MKRALWFLVPMVMVLALTAALVWLVHPEAVEDSATDGDCCIVSLSKDADKATSDCEVRRFYMEQVPPVWKTLNDFALIHVVPAFREGSTTEVVGVREIRRLPVQVDLESGALRLPPELMKGASEHERD